MVSTILLSILAVMPGAPVLTDLEAKIALLIKGHDGKVAVAMKHLPTGETILINAGEVLPTASLIKFPIMIEAYEQAKLGKVKLDDMLTLTKEEMVPGSGILTEHFSPGTQLSLRDAIRLMIVFSDNTATNMVLERVGIQQVNNHMNRLQCPETRINAKVYKGSVTSVDPARTKAYGLGSTTAKDMLYLFEKLHDRDLVSKEASLAMLTHLNKCDDGEKFPLRLPAGVGVAHKTGSVSDARTDAGVMAFSGGPVVLCVLTSQNKDKRWVPENAGNKLCADIAYLVYTHYHQPKK